MHEIDWNAILVFTCNIWQYHVYFLNVYKNIGSKEPLLAGVLFDDVSQLSNSSSFCFASASPDTVCSRHNQFMPQLGLGPNNKHLPKKYPERRSAWQMLTNTLKLWPCHATQEYINRINYIVCKQCLLAFVLGRCGWDITTPSGNFHHWHSQTRSFKPAAMTTICTFQESVVKTCHKMV